MKIYTKHKVRSGDIYVEIPDMWLVGFTHNGRTVQEAVEYYVRQERLEIAFEKQQAKERQE